MFPIRLNLADSALGNLVSVRYQAVGSELSVSRGMSQGAFPQCGLLLSGVTPLSGGLHQLGGGVMLPNWCNAP